MKTATISRQILPRKLQVKLPWFHQGTFVSATAAVSYTENLLSLNNLSDPGDGFTNHLPRGYNSWSPFYLQYLVKGVSYDVAFRLTTNLDDVDYAKIGLCGLTCGRGTWNSEFGSLVDQKEGPPSNYAKSRHMTSGSTSTSDISTNWGNARMKGYLNLRKLAQEQYGNILTWPRDFVGLAGNAPPNLLTMVLWVASLPQGSGTSGAIETNNLPGVVFEAKLTFYVAFDSVDFPS